MADYSACVAFLKADDGARTGRAWLQWREMGAGAAGLKQEW